MDCVFRYGMALETSGTVIWGTYSTANGCEITYQTLINEELLPAGYTGTNAKKSTYKILLKRSGAAPDYVINGLITTSSPWKEGKNVRYDLLGKAVQAAGG